MRKHLFVSLMLLAGAPLCAFHAQAEAAPQTQSQSVATITGSVFDENNEPVIGANVTPKGATGLMQVFATHYIYYMASAADMTK